jgi:osmotically-inducible protein OsmY
LKQGTETKRRKTMKFTRALAIALVAGATLAGTGCSVMRGQETAGGYVDDTSITTAIKAKFVEDKTVDAAAIKVETLHGTVQLSGFAKSNAERAQAESIARNTKGVRAVQNNRAVRP